MHPRPRDLAVLDLVLEAVGVRDGVQRLALDLELRDGRHHVGRDAGALALHHERALGVGQRDHGAAELDHLERRVLRHVARAGHGDALALETIGAGVFEHVLDVLRSSTLA